MSELHRGALVDDRYVVEGLLGRGGMAAVYLARHTRLGSYHAIKVLEMDRPSVRKRLVREGSVQSKLKHGNIVSVTDAIDIDGRAALVMEYVHGPNLASVVFNATQSGKALPLDHVDALAAGLFDGLEAAHALDVVHRDLKPHNVILQVDGDEVVPKIADFGLVKVLHDEGDAQTRTGMFCGTPEYMSPEQARSAKRVDTRADLFSLGVVLYELLSGLRPFDGEDMVAIVNKVAAGERRSLEEVAPHAPERMRRAVDAALVVDRDQRVQTVADLRALWFDGTVPEPPAWELEWLRSLIDAIPEPAETAVDVDPPPIAQGTTLAPPTSNPTATWTDEALPPTTDPGPQPRGQVPWMPVVAGVAVALGSGLAGLGFFSTAMSMLWVALSRPEQVAVDVPEPTPVVAPAPVADPEPIAQPEPDPQPEPEPDPQPEPVAKPGPVAQPEPVPTAEPLPQPEPEPVAEPVPKPEPAPAPVVPPKVTVKGASFTVALRDLASGKTVEPGDAQPGRYEVVAFFQPNEPTTVDTLDLASGDDVEVRCNASRCAVKR